MKNNIKFSICIPNYNYANYIGETIQSVLNQTYSNFEIIIADNSSEDESVAVAKSFDDSRISIFCNNYNIGFSPNLDKASQKAKGDYIILLSSDDIMYPNALEEYYNIISKYHATKENLILMSACNVINSKSKIIDAKNAMTGDVLKFLKKQNIKMSHNSKYHKFNGLFILNGLLSSTFQPAGQFLTTCFSKKLYDNVEGYNSILSIWPDAHFSHKLLFEDPLVLYTEKKLFGYRVHQQNNLAATESLSNIKALTDGYHLTILYPDSILKRIKLNQKLLKITFIKNMCISPSLISVLKGNFKKAFHYMAFAFASYPLITIRQWKTFVIFFAIPFTFIFKIFYKIWRFVK